MKPPSNIEADDREARRDAHPLCRDVGDAASSAEFVRQIKAVIGVET